MIKFTGDCGLLGFWSNPSDWSKSETDTFYKGKGDPLKCESYRHPIIETRIRKKLENVCYYFIKIDFMKFGFMGGRSTTDAVFRIRQLKKMFAEKKNPRHQIFVYLEKAFDRVPWELIPCSLRQHRVPENLVRLIMFLYTESNTTEFAGRKDAVITLLFMIVMEEVTIVIFSNGRG